MTFYTKATVGLAMIFTSSPAWGQSGACPASPNRPLSADESAAIEPSEVPGFQFSFPALGTRVDLTVFSKDPSAVQRALDLAQAEVRKLENILTDYDSDSETRQLTDKAYLQTVHVSDPLWQVLDASEAWHARTDGAFDCSLGAVTQLWRSSRRQKQLPSQDDIQEALRHCGWKHVQLDREAKTIELLTDGLRLDFGAIGKGYIADRVYDLLVASELRCCLVNISGNMRMGEAPPGRVGWRVEIASPKEGGEPLRRIECSQCAIATSGDLWQYVVIDGVRRSHILDPATGLGVPGPIAASVLGKTATDADAFATAACVLGPAKAIALAEKLIDIELLIANTTQLDQLKVAETRNFPKAIPPSPAQDTQ